MPTYNTNSAKIANAYQYGMNPVSGEVKMVFAAFMIPYNPPPHILNTAQRAPEATTKNATRSQSLVREFAASQTPIDAAAKRDPQLAQVGHNCHVSVGTFAPTASAIASAHVINNAVRIEK
jgi:hypothetical protein